MTHYTVDYSKLEGKAKAEKALEDIVEYMGEERFEKITAELRKALRLTDEQLIAWLDFAGVQGYPARAWVEHIRGTGEPKGPKLTLVK